MPGLCASAVVDDHDHPWHARFAARSRAGTHGRARALEQAHGWPRGSVSDREGPKTSGDRIQDRPLGRGRGQGAVDQGARPRACSAGETDCSVHSMKDVESDRPAALRIAAMLPRADVRDRLIGAGSLADSAARRGGRNEFAAPCGTGAAHSPRPQDRLDPRQCRDAAGEARGWRRGRDIARRGGARPARASKKSGMPDCARRHAAGPGAGRGRHRVPRRRCPDRRACSARSTMATPAPRSPPNVPSRSHWAGPATRRSPRWRLIKGRNDRFPLRDFQRGWSRRIIAETARFAVGDLDVARGPGPSDAETARTVSIRQSVRAANEADPRPAPRTRAIGRPSSGPARRWGWHPLSVSLVRGSNPSPGRRPTRKPPSIIILFTSANALRHGGANRSCQLDGRLKRWRLVSPPPMSARAAGFRRRDYGRSRELRPLLEAAPRRHGESSTSLVLTHHDARDAATRSRPWSSIGQ